jgi:uncharacterized protein (DUF1330 family)
MKTCYVVTITLLAGIGIGAAAVQTLHAQAKPKAYVITELETLDATAAKAFVGKAEAAQTKAGGISFHTGGGRITALEGGAAPPRVAINEWKNVDEAKAFFNSKAYTDLLPERDKAIKTIRRYIVEAR